jgi:hypothetical protein
LMVGNFILNGCTMTKPMRTMPAKPAVAAEWRIKEVNKGEKMNINI